AGIVCAFSAAKHGAINQLISLAVKQADRATLRADEARNCRKRALHQQIFVKRAADLKRDGVQCLKGIALNLKLLCALSDTLFKHDIKATDLLVESSVLKGNRRLSYRRTNKFALRPGKQHDTVVFLKRDHSASTALCQQRGDQHHLTRGIPGPLQRRIRSNF